MNTTSLDYFIGTVSWNNKDNKTTKLIVKNTSITINPSCLKRHSWNHGLSKTSHYPWHVWEDNAYIYNICVCIYIYTCNIHLMHFNETQFEGIILDLLCKTMYVKDLYLPPRKTILVEGQWIHYHFVRQALGSGQTSGSVRNHQSHLVQEQTCLDWEWCIYIYIYRRQICIYIQTTNMYIYIQTTNICVYIYISIYICTYIHSGQKWKYQCE